MTEVAETSWRSRIVGHANVPPTDLVPNPENWRAHPQAQRDALGGALEEVGWVTEVIVNQTTGNLVDGHLRLDLALSRSEPFVPVTYVELSHDEERLVLATLDPLAAMADAEVIPLNELLAQLDPNNAALRGLLDDLGEQYETKRPGLVDPDEAPDLAEETDVKRGDLFVLGDHRLLCGDATDAADVERLFDGSQADIVWTDPPYGVEYQTKLSVEEAVKRHRRTDGLEVANDHPVQTRELVTDALRNAPLKAGGAFYVASPSGDMETVFRAVLEEVGYQLRQQIVWVKDVFVMGRQDYHWRHETVLYGWQEGAAHHWGGGRKQDTVWEIPRPRRSESHPTMKPVELVARSLGNSSRPREIVYDPFMGSGTTIIAAEQLGRRAYGMDIDPRYVAVAVERWETFTGRQAVKQ